MNKEDFAYIGCRLLSLYWAFKTLNAISSLVTTWAAWQLDLFEFPSELAGVFYLGLVTFVIYLLIAVVLWFGAARIAQFLIPTASVENEGGTITLFQAQSVAFAAVGILILLTSVPEMGGVLFKMYQLKALDSHNQASLGVQAQVFEISIQVLLGVLLLFGSKGLSGLLIRFREAGLK